MYKNIIRQKVKLQLKRNTIDFTFIFLGILSAGLGLKGFLIPNSFIDGGVMGISLLVSEITLIPLSLLVVLINIPFIIMGYFQFSKIFALKSVIAVSLLALCLIFIPYPIVTKDKLLVSVFGGFFLGAGIGFAIRGGSVIDGTEILALYISKKTSATIGDIILILNIIIFSSAALLFGIEVAFYSILIYLSASRTVDFIIDGIEEYTGVTIISENSERIRIAIINKLGRGVTIFKGSSGFGKRGEIRKEMDIIFTVITRLEVSKLKNIIDLIDENAFVFQYSINETKGGMIKKRPLR